MSGDEIGALLVSGVAGFILWARWFWTALSPPPMISPRGSRWPLTLTPFLAGVLLLLVLLNFSSHDVQSDAKYVFFYLVMGAAWIGLACLFLPVMGLHPRDDVVERRNAAARPAVAGALIGLSLCFAGGNIGDGPGWWVVVFAALLATGAWYALWLLTDLLGRVSEQVAVERDVAAGVRLGALLAAMGLILGRSVAGTWISADATFGDFVTMGWPTVAFAVAEAFIARVPRLIGMTGPTPVALLGVLPAAGYLGGATLYVAGLGWWT